MILQAAIWLYNFIKSISPSPSKMTFESDIVPAFFDTIGTLVCCRSDSAKIGSAKTGYMC
jgi:hypothetical protein